MVNVSALRHTVQTRRISQYITGGSIVRTRDRSDSELIINTEYHRDKDKDKENITRISAIIPESASASASSQGQTLKQPQLQTTSRSRQNSAASVSQQSQQRIDIVNDLKRGLTELSTIYDVNTDNEINFNNTSIPPSSSSSSSNGSEHTSIYITIDQLSENTAKLEIISDNQRDVDMYLSYLYEVGVGRTFGSIICTPSTVLCASNFVDTLSSNTSHDPNTVDEKLLISIERDNLVEYITQWNTVRQQWLFTILSTILVTLGLQEQSIVFVIAGIALNNIAHTLVSLCAGLLSNDYELAYRATLTVCIMNGMSVTIAALIGVMHIHILGIVVQPDYLSIIGNHTDMYTYSQLISYIVIGFALGLTLAYVQVHGNIHLSAKLGISSVILPLL
jgi:hypothetical protein